MSEERNSLVEQYAYLVPITVNRAVPRVPWRIDRDDLVSEGYLALIDAAERFDPERGVKFTTWAMTKIRRRILEYLRQEDWVPRSERDKQKRGEAAVLLAVVSFDDPACGAQWAPDDPFWETVVERVPDPTPGPEEIAVMESEREQLWKLVEQLHGRERRAIDGFYREEATALVLAERWGCTDSNVWNARSQALKRLREWEGLAA